MAAIPRRSTISSKPRKRKGKDVFKVSMSTEFFFDRKNVEAAIGRGAARAQRKQASFLKRTASQSIKRRKTSSRPGQPPHARSSDRTRSLKNIRYAYNPNRRSTVVGPVALPRKAKYVVNRIPPPGTLEQGASILFRKGAKDVKGGMWNRDAQGRFTGGRRNATLQRPKRVVIRPRPFMVPALMKEVRNGNIAKAWTNVVY